MDWLKNWLDFDRLSFLIGFLTGIAFSWIIKNIRSLTPGLNKSLTKFRLRSRDLLQSTSEIQYRKRIYDYSQSFHLLAKYCSLDEICILPKFIFSQSYFSQESQFLDTDITSQGIPYLPEWTEFAANYQSHSISLSDALQNGANILLIGAPGSGKTTALTHLVSAIAKKDPSIGQLCRLIPMYIHVSELDNLPNNSESVFKVIGQAVVGKFSLSNQGRILRFIKYVVESKRGLLLIDGLDELPSESAEKIIYFIELLKQQYPDLRLVVSSSTEYCGNMIALKFVPISILAWNQIQKEEYLRKWESILKDISKKSYLETNQTGFLVFKRWVIENNLQLFPHEFVINIFGLSEGISIPQTPLDIMDYWVKLHIDSNHQKQRLGTFAVRLLEQGTPFFDEKNPELENINIDDLLDKGLFTLSPNAKLRFSHISNLSFLAAHSIKDNYPFEQNGKTTNKWVARELANHYTEISEIAEAKVEYSDCDDPILNHFLNRVRKLRYQSNPPAAIIKKLTECIESEDLPLSLRAKAISALYMIRWNKIVQYLFNLIHSNSATNKHLAALCLGILKEKKSIEVLSLLLSESNPSVYRTACLALVSINTQQSIDIVASALLHGHENLQRCAAEALSNQPEDGHSILREAAALDDLLIRRASIFGLRRIQESWAKDLLHAMQIDENQWVVIDTALQALTEASSPELFFPVSPADPSNQAWLIKHASSQGIGVSPGKISRNLIESAIMNQDEDTRLAALEYLKIFGDKDYKDLLENIFKQKRGEIQDAAYQALWFIELSDPYTRY